MGNRGYFEIGVYGSKCPDNVGTLMRSAFQMGAAGIFTIGARYPKPVQDTIKSYRHVPLRHYKDMDEFLSAGVPDGAELVGVETSGLVMSQFGKHPERCVYLLGAEDKGLPVDVIKKCDRVVSIESMRTASFNVAVAGSIVMYGRLFGRFGRYNG